MERNYSKINKNFSYLAAVSLGIVTLAQLITLVIHGVHYIGLCADGVTDGLRQLLSCLINFPALLLQVPIIAVLLIRKKHWIAGIAFLLPVLYDFLILYPVQIICQGSYSFFHIISSYLTYVLQMLPMVLFYGAVATACCTKGLFPGKKWGFLLLLQAAGLYISVLLSDFVSTLLLVLFKWIATGQMPQLLHILRTITSSASYLFPTMVLNIPVILIALAFFLPDKEIPVQKEVIQEIEESKNDTEI